jgi:molybdopterin converting factor small subunit
MARVIFGSDLLPQTGGQGEVEVAARNYRDLLLELQRRFPQLGDDTLEKLAIAIDGVIIHEPLLQTFSADSELVFVPRIAAG